MSAASKVVPLWTEDRPKPVRVIICPRCNGGGVPTGLRAHDECPSYSYAEEAPEPDEVKALREAWNKLMKAFAPGDSPLPSEAPDIDLPLVSMKSSKTDLINTVISIGEKYEQLRRLYDRLIDVSGELQNRAEDVIDSDLIRRLEDEQ